MATPRKVGKHWEINVELPRGTDGRRRRTKYSALTKEAVLRKARGEQAAADQGVQARRTTITLGEWLERWLSLHHTGAPVTLQGYRSIVRTHLGPLAQGRMTSLERGHLLALYQRIREQGRSESTVLHVHRFLRMVLEDAKVELLIGRNPTDGMRGLKVSPRLVRPLTVAELSAVLVESRDSPAELLVHLAVYTGMRRSEMLGLRWSDIDWERGTLMVSRARHAERRGGLVEKLKRSTSYRVVSLPASLLAMLRRRQQHPEAFMVPLTYDQVNQFLRGKPYTLQQLRHTQASLLLAQNIPVTDVAARLGHTVAVMLRTYAHMIPGKERSTAEAVDLALSDGATMEQR